MGAGAVTIWGVPLSDINQASDFNGMDISIYGGMQKGLPLANPNQAGLLVSGNILQCFGNWIGTNMTLDFVIRGGPAMAANPGGLGTLSEPRNIVLNWAGGAPLGPALKSAIQTAFPGFMVKVNISSKIVRPVGDSPFGMYSTLEQLAADVLAMSLSIVQTPGYAGVFIVPVGSTIEVFDNQTGTPTLINFQDLIGQPTWIQSPLIQFKTVMRGDLAVGSQINLPQTITTNTQEANSYIVNQKATFQGGFVVQSLWHYGNYRQPTADAWATVIEAAPLNGGVSFKAVNPSIQGPR